MQEGRKNDEMKFSWVENAQFDGVYYSVSYFFVLNREYSD